jgi:hypothetical protein
LINSVSTSPEAFTLACSVSRLSAALITEGSDKQVRATNTLANAEVRSW